MYIWWTKSMILCSGLNRIASFKTSVFWCLVWNSSQTHHYTVWNLQYSIHSLIWSFTDNICQKIPHLFCRTYTVLPLASVLHLPGLLVPIHLHTQVVPILLPVHATVSYIEQVTYTQLCSVGYGDDGHTSRIIVHLRNPVGNIVVNRTPWKVSATSWRCQI